MLEDELFEVQERPFMRDLLSHLYECFPGILCGKFCAIWTLAMLYKVFDLERPLKDRVCKNLGRQRERELEIS